MARSFQKTENDSQHDSSGGFRSERSYGKESRSSTSGKISNAEELTEAIPALKLLAQERPTSPSHVRWTQFQKDLHVHLAEKRHVGARRRAWLVGKLSSPWSIRALIAAGIAALLGAVAWVVSEYVPMTPAHAMVPAQRSVAARLVSRTADNQSAASAGEARFVYLPTA